eukprot:scaffold4489_cov165-Amphora_coffeaeformis.AAC.4
MAPKDFSTVKKNRCAVRGAQLLYARRTDSKLDLGLGITQWIRRDYLSKQQQRQHRKIITIQARRFKPSRLKIMKKGGLISLICYVGKALIILHLCSSEFAEGIAVEICPSRVALNQVTHSYPDTLWRRLTSSVPRRPQALSDIELDFSAEFCLLTGPSSAGKSTIFRLIQGKETPAVAGTVEIVGCRSPKRFSISSEGASIEKIVKRTVHSPPSVALPVVLDEKPTLDPNKSPRLHLLRYNLQEASSAEALVNVLFHIFDATDWMDTKSSELSQSQLYLIKLMEASLVSMTKKHHQQVKSTTNDNDSQHAPVYPAPILLLDEWLDTETSSVIQSVQATLQRVCQATGSVVVCATHVPDRFQRCRHVKLQNGRLLLDQSALIQRQPGKIQS